MNPLLFNSLKILIVIIFAVIAYVIQAHQFYLFR